MNASDDDPVSDQLISCRTKDYIAAYSKVVVMPGFKSLLGGLRRAESQLDKQLTSVRDAIAALSTGAGGVVGAGRASRRSGSGGGRRGQLSAAGRKAISDAQKKRWAKHKAGK